MKDSEKKHLNKRCADLACRRSHLQRRIEKTTSERRKISLLRQIDQLDKTRYAIYKQMYSMEGSNAQKI